MLLLRGATSREEKTFHQKKFQYMLLLRGATRDSRYSISLRRFQYMLLLRGATRRLFLLICGQIVSIHAPLARSNFFPVIPAAGVPVSIHAPLARSNGVHADFRAFKFVSIHAPLARSNILRFPAQLHIEFQYMLLLRGATWRVPCWKNARKKFQYMLLLRGATHAFLLKAERVFVSIHAPLARSNVLKLYFKIAVFRFNTCSSCEEQPSGCWDRGASGGFNTCSSCEEQHTALILTFVLMCFNTCSSCEEQQRHSPLGGI